MRFRKWIATAGWAVLLSACGGGDSGDSRTPSFQKTFNITPSSDEYLLDWAFFYESVSLYFASQAEFAFFVLRSNEQSSVSGPCERSGSISFSRVGGNLSSPTLMPGEKVTTVYEACESGGVAISGRLTFSIKEYAISATGEQRFAFDLSIDKFTVVGNGQTQIFDGAGSAAIEHSNKLDSYKLSGANLSVTVDGGAGEAKNLSVSLVDDYQTGAYSHSIDADVTHPSGSFLIRTETPIGGSLYLWPTSANLTFSGANGTMLRITPSAADPQNADVQFSGTGATSSQRSIRWTDFLESESFKPLNPGAELAVTGPELEVSPTAITVTADTQTGGPLPVQVDLNIRNANIDGFHVRAQSSGGAIYSTSDPRYLTAHADSLSGNFVAFFYDASVMGAGVYTDSITVSICTDSTCARHVRGSPAVIPVIYTVTGDATPTASIYLWNTSVAVEAGSDQSLGPVAKILISEYSAPPFIRYVPTLTPSGVVAGASVQRDPELGLVLAMTSPSLLEPGVYTDTVQLAACFDAGCTSQAANSPWTIEVAYVVPALRGRDFEQIATLNAGVADLIWEPHTEKLLVLVNEPYTNDPDSLMEVDPRNGATGRTLALPGSATQLAIAEDGQFGFVTYSESGRQFLARVRLSDFTIVGSTQLGDFGAVDFLGVAPGSSDTVLMNAGAADRVISVHDGLTPRPDSYALHDNLGNIWVQWGGDGSRFFAYDAGSASLRDVAVTPSGVGALSATTVLNIPDYRTGNMIYRGDRIYSSAGFKFNPDSKLVEGSFELRTPRSDSYGLIGIDANIGLNSSGSKAFFIYPDFGSSPSYMTVQAFDTGDFRSLGLIRLPELQGGGKLHITPWGQDGIAIANYEKLIILSGRFAGP